MKGLGTLINVGAILAGGLIGLFGGNLLKDNIRDSLIRINGVAVMFIGISGAIGQMIEVTGKTVQMNGTVMMIGSLAIGTVIGELIDIEGKFETFGEWLKIRTGNAKDASFVNGFVSASLTVCIGAMAIVGAIQDGLTGNYTTLLVKAILDFLIVMVMTASLGKGCIFSFIPVGILQGCVTILAGFLAPVMTAAAQSNLSLVGNVLIFCVGVNLIRPGTFRVANILPSVVIAVIWTFV